MIPLRDQNPTARRPIVTVALIGVCIAVFVLIEPMGRITLFHQSTPVSKAEAADQFTYQYAAIPCELVRDRQLSIVDLAAGCQRHAVGQPIFPHKRVWLALLYSMFLHASVLHLAGNMLFLWIFGNNVEDRLGHTRYLLFYLVAGCVATGVYVLTQPLSTAPLVGASGAIAGVMGAYLVFFPRAPIRTLVIIPPIVLWPRLPAWMLLAFWFVSQFFVSPGSTVAWVAHVSGFAFGAMAAWMLRRRRPSLVRA